MANNVTSDSVLQSDDLKILLKECALMMKSLHGDVEGVKESTEQLRGAVDGASVEQKQQFSKLESSVSERQTKLEHKVDNLSIDVQSMKCKLDAILTLISGGQKYEADVKTGGEVLEEILRKDDDSGDGVAIEGEAEATRSPKVISGQTLTTSPTNADAQDDMMIETGADATKFMQQVRYEGKTADLYYRDPKLMLYDEEAAIKVFEEENPGMNLEELLKAEKEFKQAKEKKDKKKATRPKQKGIVISEPATITNYRRRVTRAMSAANSEREKDKGKQKVDEPVIIAKPMVELDEKFKPTIGFEEEEETEEVPQLKRRKNRG